LFTRYSHPCGEWARRADRETPSAVWAHEQAFGVRRRRRRAELTNERFEARVRCGGHRGGPGGRQPLAGPRERGAEPDFVERLEQVVHGVQLEGTQRVRVIGGDEDERGRPLVLVERVEDTEAVELRHLYVEKDQVGPLGTDRIDRLEPGAAFTDHDDIRLVGEECADPAPYQRLVVDQQDAYPAGTTGSPVSHRTGARSRLPRRRRHRAG
jgi:hypothetical protein